MEMKKRNKMGKFEFRIDEVGHHGKLFATKSDFILLGIVTVIIIVIVVIRLIIAEIQEPKYSLSQIVDSMRIDIKENEITYSKFADSLMKCVGNNKIIFCADGSISPYSFVVKYNDNDSLKEQKIKRDMRFFYRECFHGYFFYISYQDSIMSIGAKYGRLKNRKYPYLVYAIDSSKVSERFPNVKIYSREEKPENNEEKFIWQLEENWWMVSDLEIKI